MNEPHPGPPDNYGPPSDYGPPDDYGPPENYRPPDTYGGAPAQPPPQSGPPAPYSGPPASYSGSPAQSSAPPASYSGPPAPYEPTQQYPAQPYAPGHARPQYGQPTPQYGQPTYGQPDQYGQPAGYGQPGPYGQAPYPQPTYGTTPYSYAPPAKTGTSATKVILIVLAVVIVIGGAIGGYVATRPSNSTHLASGAGPTTPTPTAPPTDSPTTAPPSSAAGANTIFKLPKTAAGLTLAPDSGLGALMSKSLPDGVAGETTTGLYTDPGNPNKLLILIGTQANVGNPEIAVAGAFSGMGQSPTISLKSPKSYSAGSQGGAMDCADGTLSELGTHIPVGVCAVADKHGLIITIFTSRSASSAASATRSLRPTFEHS